MSAFKWIAVLVCAAGLAGSARGDVATISAAADASIFSNNTGNSLGAGPGMFVGVDTNGQKLRSLLRFDIAANIPANATITDVKLTLHLGMVAGGGGGSGDSTPRTIELHKLTQSWGEGTTGSTSTSISQTGNGFAAGAGDATWNDSAFPSTAWTNPGGDALATASGSAVVSQTVNGSYDWTSTAAMVADVQSWLNNPTTNDGWLLENPDETTLKTFRALWTREATGSGVQPLLTVTFTPEPTTTIAPIVLGLVAMARRRRRPTSLAD